MIAPSDRTRLIISSIKARHRAKTNREAAEARGGFRTLAEIMVEFIDRLEAGEFTADDLRRMNVVD